MFELTLRREQTLSRVGEGFAAYNPLIGLFLFPGGAPGWVEAARTHLGEYLEAGLIAADGDQYQGGYRGLTLTTAGRYLLRRWHTGPAEAVVELPSHDNDATLSGSVAGADIPDVVAYLNVPVTLVDDQGVTVTVAVFGGYEPRPEVDCDTCDGDPYQEVFGYAIVQDDTIAALLRLTREDAARFGAALIAATR